MVLELVNEGEGVVQIQDVPADFPDGSAVKTEALLDPPIASALAHRAEDLNVARGHGSRQWVNDFGNAEELVLKTVNSSSVQRDTHAKHWIIRSFYSKEERLT
jgi:hypothetical protein